MSELVTKDLSVLDWFDFRTRDERETKNVSYSEITDGEIPDAYAKKISDNVVTIRNGTYPTIVVTKNNTTYNCLGEVIFKSIQVNADSKIFGAFINGTTSVAGRVTTIFNNCVFNADITVSGNAHFIGCLFKGGVVTNTGIAYIIGCSNKSGSAHTGITGTFGETT